MSNPKSNMYSNNPFTSAMTPMGSMEGWDFQTTMANNKFKPGSKFTLASYGKSPKMPKVASMSSTAPVTTGSVPVWNTQDYGLAPVNSPALNNQTGGSILPTTNNTSNALGVMYDSRPVAFDSTGNLVPQDKPVYGMSRVGSNDNINFNGDGVEKNAWNRGDTFNTVGLGLGALNTYLAFDSGKVARENMEINRKQMENNWLASTAAAQFGVERNIRRDQIASGMTGTEASAYAKANSKEEMKRYGLV